jgi:hypothetical protein
VTEYLARLETELRRVGIGGRTRARILAEAEDHLADGDPADFGDPRELAQLFADELATSETTRAAYVAFAALAAVGACFGAAWIAVPARSSPDILSAQIVPLGVAAAAAMLVLPQVSFAAGVLALLRARRLRTSRAAPAAELAVLARRTQAALVAGAGSALAFAVYAVDFRAHLDSAYVAAVASGAAALTIPLALVAVRNRRAAAVRSAVAGGAGDMFDDLPVPLPRHPWRLCLALAGAAALALLAGGGLDEGPRNAVGEGVLIVACFALLGRRLGLRPTRRRR